MPELIRSFSSRKIPVAIIALLGLMVVCAYSNTFEAPPALDDYHTFIEEPLVRIQNLTTESIWNLKQTRFGWSRWVPMLTFSINLSTGVGDEIYHLHITNIIIHLLCFLSVIFLISTLHKAAFLESSNTVSGIDRTTLAIWVAGLWTLHPLQSNAVTYIVQRMASIVALFTLLSVAFYAYGRILSKTSSSKKRAMLCYLMAILSAGISFFSKENSAIIPILLLFTELWFFSPQLIGRVVNFFRERIFLFCVALITLLIWSIYCYYVYILPGYGIRHFTVFERVLTESRIILWYTSLLLWPAPNRLSLEHDVTISTSFLDPPTTILSIVIIAVGIWWAFSRRGKYPLFTYGILWFFLNLAIESSVIPLELVFEHRMYLPSVGLLLSLVVASYRFAENWMSRRMSARDRLTCCWCLIAVVMSALCLATFARNIVWQDPLGLARDNAQKAPLNPRAHANLAVALVRNGQYEDAVHEAESAIALGMKNFEQDAVALNAIVMAYSKMGQHEQGIAKTEALLAEREKTISAAALPSVYMNLAMSEEYTGNLKEAFERVRKALFVYYRIPGISTDVRESIIGYLFRLLAKARQEDIDLDGDSSSDPGSISVATWISREFLRFGDRSTAERLLREASPHMNIDDIGEAILAILQQEEKLNQIQQAKKDFTEKYIHNPFTSFNACMALAITIQKRKILAWLSPAGEKFLDHALALDPTSADAHLLKGWYYYDKNLPEEAAKEAMRALELDPEYAKAWLGLGFFLAKANHSSEATNAFKKVLDLYPGYPQRIAIMDIISGLNTSVPTMVSNNVPSKN